jgi:hypothetical protein
MWSFFNLETHYRSGSQQRELVVDGSTMGGEHGVLAAWCKDGGVGEEWKDAIAGDEGTRRAGVVEQSTTTGGRRSRLASRRTT